MQISVESKMALDPLHGWSSQDRKVEMIGMVLAATVTQDHMDMAHRLRLLLLLHHMDMVHHLRLLHHMDMGHHLRLLHLMDPLTDRRRHTTGHHHPHRVRWKKTTLRMSTHHSSTAEDLLEEMFVSH